jgi:hypothetical protein
VADDPVARDRTGEDDAFAQPGLRGADAQRRGRAAVADDQEADRRPPVAPTRGGSRSTPSYPLSEPT